jgi:hypothetical protein
MAAAVCVIAIGAGLHAAAAPGGAERTSLVPAAQLLRLAAQCGAWRTYVPTTAPPGYRFAAWQVFGHNVACDTGFAIRFRRGDTLLTWEAGGPETYALECKGAPAARMSGTVVFHRVHGGLEKVWACVGRAAARSTVVAFQHASLRRATLRGLLRMVASARKASSDRAPDGRYLPASRAEVARMSARFGPRLFLPRELPPGFVFSAWAYRAHDPNLDDRASMILTYGSAGSVLQWGVYSGIDKLGLECPAKGNRRFPRGKPFLVIGGVSIYLIVGIHGGSVWRCIPSDAAGSAKPVEVEVWYSIGLDGPRMRRALAELVASARLVR